MADPTPGAAKSSRCYFLELPGELRNRIYDYVLIHRDPWNDKDLDIPYTVQLRAPPHPYFNCAYTPSMRYGRSWGRLKRQTLGLTQTCRAIRYEFLPLHDSRIHVELIFSDDMERYISDFFLRPEDAYGTCFLSRPREKAHIEVLPLLRCLSRAPGITLRFDNMGRRDTVNMSALMDIKGNQKWREYVENCVTGIAYYVDSQHYYTREASNQLFVNIRHTTGEPWMIEEKKEDTGDNGDSTRNKTPANKPECVKKWLEFAGIAHLDETLDDVGIQVAPADEDSESDTSSIEDS